MTTSWLNPRPQGLGWREDLDFEDGLVAGVNGMALEKGHSKAWRDGWVEGSGLRPEGNVALAGLQMEEM